MSLLTSGCFLVDSEPSEVSKSATVVAFVAQPHRACLLAQVVERHHVRIGLPLPDDQPPTLLQHPTQLAKCPILVSNLAESGDQVGSIERRVRIGERVCVPLSRDNSADSMRGRSTHRLLEHPWL